MEFKEAILREFNYHMQNVNAILFWLTSNTHCTFDIMLTN